MKKFFILAAAALTVFAACKKDGPNDNPNAAKISKLAFYVEDNSFLPDSIVFVNPSDKIAVEFPFCVADTCVKAVSVRFNLSKDGAKVIDADAKEIASGDTLDFSNPVDLMVSYNNINTKYTISISIEKKPFLKIAESSVKMNSELVMKINPANGNPGMVGQIVGKAPGYVSLAGGVLNVDTLAKITNCNYYGLDYAPDGTPFVSYYDGTSGVAIQKCGKVSGGKFVQIGTLVKATGNSVTSAPVAAISTSKIFFGCMANAATSGVSKRGLYVGESDGSTITAQPVQIANKPLADTVYNAITRTVNGTNYMLCLNFNRVRISAYKFNTNGNVWEEVFDVKPLRNDGTPITTAAYTYKSIDFDVDSKGNVYVVAIADFDGAQVGVQCPAVVKYDIQTKEQTIVGGIIKGDALNFNNKPGYRFIGLALDANDTPYVAIDNTFCVDAYGIRVSCIDPKTKVWTKLGNITNPGVDYAGIDIKFNEAGRGFIGAFNKTDGKYELFATEQK